MLISPCALLQIYIVILFQDIYHLHTFCPNSTAEPWKMKSHFWSKNNPKKLRNNNNNNKARLFQDCPHPLTGKDIRIGYNKILPGVLPPLRPGQPLSGTDVEVMRILAGKFQFKPVFVEVAHDYYVKSNQSFNYYGSTSQVQRGDVHLAIGNQVQTLLQSKFVGYTTFFGFQSLIWGSRLPIKIVNYANILRPFTPLAWLFVVCGLAAFSSAFALIYAVYRALDDQTKKMDQDQRMAGKLVSGWDFVILTFSSFVEPDPLAWFPRWSTGM